MTASRDRKAKIVALSEQHADGGTRRPATPALEGLTPLPEEITGRASGTDDDLVALMGSESGAHLTDGFRGGSDDESMADGTSTRDTTHDDAEEPLDAREP